VMMPERDGWDLLQALRHNPATYDIPVIICSVLRQHELALALGAAAYLSKPISEHSLLQALAELHEQERNQQRP
jgi:adenylate cyclase